MANVPGMESKSQATQLTYQALQQFTRTSAGGDCLETVQFMFPPDPRWVYPPDSRQTLPIVIDTVDGQVKGTCVMFYKLMYLEDETLQVCYGVSCHHHHHHHHHHGSYIAHESQQLGIQVTYEKVVNEPAIVRLVCFDPMSPLSTLQSLDRLQEALSQCRGKLAAR